MSAVKNLIIDVCEQYEGGQSIEDIARITGFSAPAITDILNEYCEQYQEDQSILKRAEEIRIYNEFG